MCSLISKESVLEIERPVARPLPLRLSASLFVWIPLEANLGLGLLRSKAAPTTSLILEPTQGNPTPFSLL